MPKSQKQKDHIKKFLETEKGQEWYEKKTGKKWLTTEEYKKQKDLEQQNEDPWGSDSD